MSLQADLLQPELGFFEDAMDLTDPETYSANMSPFGQAHALPPFAYRSKVFSELENEKIWTRSWIPIGLVQQITKPGDLLPFTLGFHGVHLQRMKDGSIESRLNRHQHGGCRFVPEQCRTGKQTKCTIASCNYTRDAHVLLGQENGENSPEMYKFVGINPDKLVPVRSETWGPLVFVNLDPQDGPLSDAMPKELWPLADPSSAPLQLVDHKWLDIKCNWKFFGTAFVDIGTGSVPTAGGVVNVIETTTDCAALGLEGGTQRVDLVWMFPNLLLARSGRNVLVIILQSTGMGNTLARVSLLIPSPQDDAVQPALASNWVAALRAIGDKAEASYDRAVKWGTSSDPETIGQLPGVETSAAKYLMEQYVTSKILTIHALHWSAPIMDARMMQRRGSQ